MNPARLDDIASVTGVRGAVICDDFGGILHAAGDTAQAGVETAVLAQAAQSAASALGHRIGLGGCTGLTQTHTRGQIHIRRTGTDRMILVWHHADADLPALDRLLSTFEPASDSPDPAHSRDLPNDPPPAHWDPFSPPPPS